jgi:4-amino-4-deoxy-L-arabinose transferase-like glycosyltransferase
MLKAVNVIQRYPRLVLSLLLFWYGLATLPYLAKYPIIESAQVGIAAPAYKLAEQGVYGNDLYRGFYNTENLNYEYMPLYPLFVAFAYKLLGLGIWQGRLVSLIFGLAVLLLTYQLGRRLLSEWVGVLAVAVLTLLPIAAPGASAGELYPGAIPLLDIARVLRYDIMVAVWVLAACLLFLWTAERDSDWGYLMTGGLVGLATLTHVYGAFILILFVVWLWWQRGWSVWRQRPFYLLALGWFVVLLPWFIYIGQDVPAYLGQQLRHGSRFDISNPGFYLNNLLREPWRYLKLVGSFQVPALWPRPGFWLMVVAVVTANSALWRRREEANGRFLLLSLPLLALLLALLISFKRYTYIILPLPFLALQIAYGLLVLLAWIENSGRVWQWALALLLLLAPAEGISSTIKNLQAAQSATSYSDLTTEIKSYLPGQARIIMQHGFWLGLASYDAFSLDLLFILSDPAYGFSNPPTIDQLIQQIAPDYIIVADHLLQSYEQPALLPSLELAQKWQALDHTLQQQCQLNGEVPTADYGLIFIFACPEKSSLPSLGR